LSFFKNSVGFKKAVFHKEGPHMRINEALAEGRSRLAQTGSAALDAGLLLSCALGVGREKLYLDSAELSPEDLSRFREYVERRLSGECTAYIIGRREFYGLDFCVNPAVLVPRPDTETLVETALDELSSLSTSRSPLFSILDLCTGSGAVAIAIKHERPELDVWAADISAKALETARANAERLLSGRGIIRFLQGDLYAPLPDDSPKFTLVTANAPYVPSAEIAKLAKEVRNEPRIALDGGEDGLGILRRIIAEAPRHLVRGGLLLLEANPPQMEKIASIMETHGLGDIRTWKDLSGHDRVIAGRFAEGITGPVTGPADRDTGGCL
jgi:release factor glutamine methyltransferase